MATTVTNVRKSEVKLVFLAHEVPEESLGHAQAAIISDGTWHLIAPNPYRIHSTADIPMPKVNCPVVDIRGVTDEEGMRRVMDACTDKSAGVINLDGLLTGLEALGAKVTRIKPDAVAINAAWRERKEGSVEKKMKVIAAYEKTKRVARRVHAPGKVKVH